jgi:hypothetical protein
MVHAQDVKPVSGVEEASECAQLMLSSEPWITLQLA